MIIVEVQGGSQMGAWLIPFFSPSGVESTTTTGKVTETTPQREQTETEQVCLSLAGPGLEYGSQSYGEERS